MEVDEEDPGCLGLMFGGVVLPVEDNLGLTMAPEDPCKKCFGEAEGVPDDEYFGVVDPLE